jgi:hypothetical protein
MIALVVAFSGRAVAGNSNVTITVNAQANQHAIDPRIYGVAFASSTDLLDLNCPLNRSGGNSTTRYNWQTNASNHAADWYFESIDDGSPTPGASADSFISNSKTGGAEPLLTIPMIGWVANLAPGRNKLWSYSIFKYGPQTGSDSQWCPDAGNGALQSTGQNITNNDPNDASVLTDSTFQQNWVRHLTNRWGAAANGGVKYYILDNEHSIWHGTHSDVHPVGATMEEIRNKMIDFAGKIKAVESNAIVVGPEEWGWSGYLLSGYDQWYGPSHGWSSPDRNAHGGMDYMPWLLDQLRQTNNITGQRLLDVFSLHIYPQGGEFGNDVSTSMQLLRNRSTRSLWDSNYVDETWINTQVELIPRMKNWVNTYYPGTKIAITEYNWGAEGYINGATAQADILGIFGREGLDIATRWTTPASNTPTYLAIKIFRNYDGANSTFGDMSILSTASISADCVSSFAATRSSDGAMTIMVINKMLSDIATIKINLTNFNTAATGQVWQLTSATAIQHLANVSLSGKVITTDVPAQSITLFVVPSASAGSGDGIPDNWKLHYFNSTNAVNGGATNDWDHDGMHNLDEYIAGTDPTNANSRFTLLIGQTNGSVDVRFPALLADSNYCPGLTRYYLLEYSTNLLLSNGWIGLQNYTNIAASGQTIIYTNIAPYAQRFYRAKVWLK